MVENQLTRFYCALYFRKEKMAGTIDLSNPINQLSAKVVDIAFHVHQELGPGLFESVYEEILYHELNFAGLLVERQKAIPITWKGEIISRPAFKADLIIENKILIELKSVEGLAVVHYKQVETYLRLTSLKLGLLINFNEAYFKDAIHRIVNRL
jgi:GxxExxY protein